MRAMGQITFVMLLFSAMLTEQVANAATYYVAITGNNSNPGTLAAPFRTISKGMSVTVAGDTVYVMNGTYIEGLQIDHSGNSGAPITLSAYPGHSPAIKNEYDGEVINVASARAYTPVGWLIIDGFEIYNTYPGNKTQVVGISLYNVHDTIIRRNIIHDARQGIQGNGKNVTITRNIIRHNGRFGVCATTPAVCNQDHGIYGSGSNWDITNNLIYDNLGYGIQIAAYPFKTGRYIDADYAGATGWLVAHNTIAYNHYRSAIVVWQSGATNGTFKNNIFYENAQKQVSGNAQGIDFYGSGAGHVVQNNVFYATTPGGTTWIADSGTSYSAFGNLTTSNPLFVNAGADLPASPDFQLRSGSPAINAGISLPEVTTDFRGVGRPIQGAYDIGAYEGVGSDDTTAPMPPLGLRIF